MRMTLRYEIVLADGDAPGGAAGGVVEHLVATMSPEAGCIRTPDGRHLGYLIVDVTPPEGRRPHAGTVTAPCSPPGHPHLAVLPDVHRAPGRPTGVTRPRDSRQGLTRREGEVLELVAEGMSNKAIAERLFLSPRTVEKHVERLLTKTGTSNRAQLVGYSLRADAS